MSTYFITISMSLFYYYINFCKDQLEASNTRKTKIFTWLVFQNKILTASNLSKKNIQVPIPRSLCNSEEKTGDHLFLACSYSKQIWQLIILALGISQMLISVEHLWTIQRKNIPSQIAKPSWDYIASVANTQFRLLKFCITEMETWNAINLRKQRQAIKQVRLKIESHHRTTVEYSNRGLTQTHPIPQSSQKPFVHLYIVGRLQGHLA